MYGLLRLAVKAFWCRFLGDRQAAIVLLETDSLRLRRYRSPGDPSRYQACLSASAGCALCLNAASKTRPSLQSGLLDPESLSKNVVCACVCIHRSRAGLAFDCLLLGSLLQLDRSSYVLFPEEFNQSF